MRTRPQDHDSAAAFVGRVLPAVVLAGCNSLLGIDEPTLASGDGGLPADARAADAAPADADVTAVTGTVTRTFIDETGRALAVEPDEVTAGSIAAYVPDGEAPGSYRVVPAETAGGAFRIPGVHPPTGSRVHYLLRTTEPDAISGTPLPRFLVTDAALVTLDETVLGRPGAERPTEPTQLAFDLTEMDAWQETDALQLYVANTSAVELAVRDKLSNPPGMGDVRLTGMLDWSTVQTVGGAAAPLIRGSLGDRVVISHLASRTSPTGLPYRSSIELHVADPFEQVDGQTRLLAGPFGNPAQAGRVHVLLGWDAFLALDGEVHPRAYAEPRDQSGLFVHAQPGIASGTRQITATADALGLVLDPATRGDVATGTLTYAPYLEAWGEIVTIIRWLRIAYDVPGADAPTTPGVRHRIDFPRSAVSEGMAIEPRLSPPRNLRIDGHDLWSEPTVLHAPSAPAPLVSWDAPRLGTPTRYTVRVFRLVVTLGAATVVNVGAVVTANLSVRVPWELFAPGHHVILVSATMDSGGGSSLDPVRFPAETTSAASDRVTFTAP